MTKLAHANGDQVLLIDSDLDEEPECLIAFAELMKSQRCDVVYGVQEQRKGIWFKRWSGRWFYHFSKALAGFSLPENIVTARLMTRNYADALLRHGERDVFMAGLWHITAFDQKP
jgi:putative glycosyltransferase